jgi:hypothetical protein
MENDHQLVWKCTSGCLYISDPGYTKEDEGINTAFSLGKKVDNAKNGYWYTNINIAPIRDWGHRVSKIECFVNGESEESKEGKEDRLGELKEEDGHVGVDSGQMCISDYSFYPIGITGDYENKNSFYGRCCEITTSYFGGTIADNEDIAKGVVCSSGIGDGYYEYKVYRNPDGYAVKVMVNFINDNIPSMADLERNEEN